MLVLAVVVVVVAVACISLGPKLIFPDEAATRDHDSDRPTTTARPTPATLDFDSTPRLPTPSQTPTNHHTPPAPFQLSHDTRVAVWE